MLSRKKKDEVPQIEQSRERKVEIWELAERLTVDVTDARYSLRPWSLTPGCGTFL